MNQIKLKKLEKKAQEQDFLLNLQGKEEQEQK